ncbi:MAG: YqfO family protein [Halieaceae bacterium]|nr:YqfO family protein [Halieaceae bacterium]
MKKLVFFVPETHLEFVKLAVFEAGAGQIGNYEHCCWQTLGAGQFKPMSGAAPFIGQSGQLEVVSEYRVELVCDDAYLKGAVLALRRAHPYEEPAFDITNLIDPESL